MPISIYIHLFFLSTFFLYHFLLWFLSHRCIQICSLFFLSPSHCFPLLCFNLSLSIIHLSILFLFSPHTQCVFAHSHFQFSFSVVRVLSSLGLVCQCSFLSSAPVSVGFIAMASHLFSLPLLPIYLLASVYLLSEHICYVSRGILFSFLPFPITFFLTSLSFLPVFLLYLSLLYLSHSPFWSAEVWHSPAFSSATCHSVLSPVFKQYSLIQVNTFRKGCSHHCTKVSELWIFEFVYFCAQGFFGNIVFHEHVLRKSEWACRLCCFFLYLYLICNTIRPRQMYLFLVSNAFFPLCSCLCLSISFCYVAKQRLQLRLKPQVAVLKRIWFQTGFQHTTWSFEMI